MTLASLLTWAGLQGRGARLELACAEHPDPRRGARGWTLVAGPGCVADWPDAVVAELFALGVRAISVRADGCAAPERLADRLERWRVPLELAGRRIDTPAPGRSRRVVRDGAAMPTVARRTLLGLGRRQDPDDGATWRPDTAGTDHRRLVAALERLGAEPGPAGEAPGPGLLLRAPTCSVAGQCVVACPEDALRLTTEGDVTRLEFDLQRCSGCGDCLRYCNTAAIRSEGPASWNTLLSAPVTTLATRRTRVCERCRTRFVPDGEARLCPVCTERRARPFGTSLPPEALARLRPRRDDGAAGRPR
ncbi:NADH-quinone oxidoreductase subunit I [uncultured Tessaracoccus sp.]|mgnify:CR=1 FL=1|uniref:NADH-quinone oxidoreductase subunit I n=1 Tax=uncultured Tessaracoccus sp. TaxID=905023 RepID=UPI0025CD46AA|nr:4Fe-4S dicluster domain-containing protein [uncultured Tessaracoccus sp.]